jgi:hypothetical protein
LNREIGGGAEGMGRKKEREKERWEVQLSYIDSRGNE